MNYVLRPAIAELIGPEAAKSVNDSMDAIVKLSKPAAATDAHFALARHLFELEHTPNEGMDP